LGIQNRKANLFSLMDAQNISDKTQEWRERGEEAAQGIKERAQEWQRRASDGARKAAAVTNDYVHDNPWESVGYVAAGAFVIGFLIGRLAGRD
jgi:ElaB/YqjD/DUF883 family membrane-anchored ribosome-binding protein